MEIPQTQPQLLDSSEQHLGWDTPYLKQHRSFNTLQIPIVFTPKSAENQGFFRVQHFTKSLPAAAKKSSSENHPDMPWRWEQIREVATNEAQRVQTPEQMLLLENVNIPNKSHGGSTWMHSQVKAGIKKEAPVC